MRAPPFLSNKNRMNADRCEILATLHLKMPLDFSTSGEKLPIMSPSMLKRLFLTAMEFPLMQHGVEGLIASVRYGPCSVLEVRRWVG